MMPSPGGSQESPVNINNFQDMMMNLVYNFTSIVTMPVEMALRPHYGSEYFPPIIMFFTAVMMTLLPLFSAIANGIIHMLPFAGFRGPVGLIGMGGFSRLFFLGAFVHGFRVWRRMLHMELEENSLYEGPPLPVFKIVPCSWWTTRIVVEPLFVFVLSGVLPNFFIIEPSVAHYLAFAAMMLAMKQYVAWFQQWRTLRHLVNMRNVGPIIAKIVDDRASQEDLASVHLAAFPKNLPDDIRRAAALHIARVFAPETEIPDVNCSKKGETHESDSTEPDTETT
jgi:hypothetical protein